VVEYKYNAELDKLPDCPPSVAHAKKIEAFRFVFDDINHPHNFLPALKIKPTRKFKNDQERCMAYGLSMFDSMEKAKDKYAKLEKSIPKIGKRIGTHIAKGLLEEADGVTTKADKRGHFTLYEFKGTDLKAKFHIVSKAG
jgi:hypothetical protein